MGTRTHAHIAEGEPSGLSEADIAASITTLEKLSNTCDADISRLRTHDEEAGQVAEFLVRRRCAPDKFSEVRVAVVGNVDAGKRCSRFLGIAAHRQTQTNTRAHTHLHTHTHTLTHVLTHTHTHAFAAQHTAWRADAQRAGQRARAVATEALPPPARDGHGANIKRVVQHPWL